MSQGPSLCSTTVSTASNMLATLVSAVLLFGEALGVQQVAGVCLLVVGAWCIQAAVAPTRGFKQE
jgi:drug/metabolite transporter (DMT)-like permease